jgi:hypothetical protein
VTTAPLAAPDTAARAATIKHEEATVAMKSKLLRAITAEERRQRRDERRERRRQR